MIFSNINDIIKRISMMKLFCSHHYELSNHFEIKSEFDIVVENGYVPNTWNCRKRKYVTDYVCKKMW